MLFPLIGTITLFSRLTSPNKAPYRACLDYDLTPLSTPQVQQLASLDPSLLIFHCSHEFEIENMDYLFLFQPCNTKKLLFSTIV